MLGAQDWIVGGTDLVCVQELDLKLTGSGSPLVIPKGTEAIIELTYGAYVQLHLEIKKAGRWQAYTIKQLRGDLVSFWQPKGALKPPRARPKRSQVVLVDPSRPGQENLSGVRYVGFWASSANPAACYYEQKGILLPWPEDHIDRSWVARERAIVVAYLRAAPPVEHYFGFSWCRCGCKNDINMGANEHSDEVYQWPEGYAHYVEEHGVRPPQELIDHILRQSTL